MDAVKMFSGILSRCSKFCLAFWYGMPISLSLLELDAETTTLSIGCLRLPPRELDATLPRPSFVRAGPIFVVRNVIWCMWRSQLSSCY